MPTVQTVPLKSLTRGACVRQARRYVTSPWPLGAVARGFQSDEGRGNVAISRSSSRAMATTATTPRRANLPPRIVGRQATATRPPSQGMQYWKKNRGGGLWCLMYLPCGVPGDICAESTPRPGRQRGGATVSASRASCQRTFCQLRRIAAHRDSNPGARTTLAQCGRWAKMATVHDKHGDSSDPAGAGVAKWCRRWSH